MHVIEPLLPAYIDETLTRNALAALNKITERLYKPEISLATQRVLTNCKASLYMDKS